MTCCSWSMNFFEGSKDISEGVAMRSKILIVIIFDVLIRVFCVGSTCDWICHVHLRVCSMIFVTFIFICSRTMSYFSLEPLSIRERGVIDCRWTSIYIATISRWRYGYEASVGSWYRDTCFIEMDTGNSRWVMEEDNIYNHVVRRVLLLSWLSWRNIWWRSSIVCGMFNADVKVWLPVCFIFP